METERIHNLIEQGHSVSRTCFMLKDNCFSQSAPSEPNTEEDFDKFSTSKTVLVGDYSKRTLVIGSELAVPLKKRKHIHEELDLCNESTDQNLQESKSNEEDMTFCPKFGNENLCASTSSASEKGLENSKIEFNLQSSVYVKADESAEWIKLKCFDSITVDGSNSATFFAGGPIQSSAFSIMPNDMTVNQYIAVAAGNAIYNNHSYNNTRNESGIIQFWNVGSLHERNSLNQSPSMEMALYHDNGIITQMKWCPADCYDDHPSTCHLPRLGLLAVSSSNSSVYIYSVPQPSCMPKTKPTFPIYSTLPFMKLIPLFGGPSHAARKAVATCIEWEKNGQQIVAGYGNGAVCVWMINLSSFASHITVKNTEQSYIIQPYLFFQASGTYITSLSFAPFNNNRWLAVSSIDKILRFFDLHDTTAPFHIAKQGLENSCIWSDTFCGVYSSPTLNSMGLISLSAKDCCTESNDRGVKRGFFDSSTCVAVSEKKNFHAIADMAGAVTVNFLKNILNPLDTSYLTYMIFETEIMALDSLDHELETSDYKISISGSLPSNDITSDTKDTFYTKIKQVSSSSSSGFCSPNNGKTIVIESNQCFYDDSVNLLKCPPVPSSMTDFKDINNNGIKAFLIKPLHSQEETNDEMIKCSGSSDLMRDLLMMKISNQSKSLSHILPFNTSSNSCCDSKGAKHLSDRAFITSPAASDYTGDTIVYPIEPCFCDTSHSNALKLNAQSTSLGLNDSRYLLHKTTVFKNNREPTFKAELFTENSLNVSSAEVKSGNSSPIENSLSENWHESNIDTCDLNLKTRNLKKINCFNDDYNSFHLIDYHFTSTHSNIPREEYNVSKKFPKEIVKSGVTLYQNLDTRGNFIFKKDAVLLSSHKSFDNPLCDLELNHLNQPKPLPDICSSITSNSFIICDKDDHQVSDGALTQSSTASDYSGDTIIYLLESHDSNKTDANCLKMEKPGATFQSLYKSEKENTFQDTLLHKMDETEVVIDGSKTKLFPENSSFARKKCEHFLTKESLKYNSEYDTDSGAQSCNSSDKGRNLFSKDILLSDFQLLHSEYLCVKSKETHTKLHVKPQELSYENLIDSFGVIFKNKLEESTNPLKKQENDIYINYNPLSVIKTISWDPNEGCQSWLFVGGNSGIGRLVFVPDFIAGKDKKPQPIHRKKRILT